MIKKCKNCNKEFKTSQSRILSGRGIFCSKKCFHFSAKGRLPWNTGKKCESLSKSKKGDKNPMWTGGVSKAESDRKYRQTESGKKSHNRSSLKYNKKNRDKINRQIRERLKVDIHFKIKRNISNGIWCKLNRYRGCKKDNRILDCLPYTIDELKRHLEVRFKKGMTWSNYGEWHIDHIRPDSSFDYTSTSDEEFKKSWALSNLQPLWAKENMSKGKKYIEQQNTIQN